MILTQCCLINTMSIMEQNNDFTYWNDEWNINKNK